MRLISRKNELQRQATLEKRTALATNNQAAFARAVKLEKEAAEAPDTCGCAICQKEFPQAEALIFEVAAIWRNHPPPQETEWILQRGPRLPSFFTFCPTCAGKLDVEGNL